MEFKLKLAGIIIHVKASYHHTFSFVADYSVEGGEPNVFITLDCLDINNEYSHSSISIDNDDVRAQAYHRRNFESQALYHRIAEIMPSFSVINMHGVIVSDGVFSYIFIAPSGVGKTTRARLFVKTHPDAFILNGDKPLIRVESNRVVACGSPWNGKEGYGVNDEIPLKAIFLLERADETQLTELTIGEAFDDILRQTYIPSNTENIIKTIQIIKAMEGKVRLYRFRSTPTEESVDAAWHAANS